MLVSPLMLSPFCTCGDPSKGVHWEVGTPFWNTGTELSIVMSPAFKGVQACRRTCNQHDYSGEHGMGYHGCAENSGVQGRA